MTAIIFPILALLTLTATGGGFAALTVWADPNLWGTITAAIVTTITIGMGTALVATNAQKPRPQHREHPIDRWLDVGDPR